MERQQTRIFLSYARKDVAEANNLYSILKRYGYSPWQDHKDLTGGRDWLEEISEVVNSCVFFLACLSQNAIDKQTGGLVQEIGEVLDIVKRQRKGSIFILPARLESVELPKEFKEYHGIDIHQPGGLEELIKALRYVLDQFGIKAPLQLRSQSIDHLKPAAAAQMIREHDFFDSLYWPGNGIYHEYKIKTIEGEKRVSDYTTGLMWQWSGSEEPMQLPEAEHYSNYLNENEFAGFNDWRLPTLEEAMSLMEAKKGAHDLYISDVFDNVQRWIWTADKNGAEDAWYIGFSDGNCDTDPIDTDASVRAVRSI